MITQRLTIAYPLRYAAPRIAISMADPLVVRGDCLSNLVARIRLSEGSGVGRRQFYRPWFVEPGLPGAQRRLITLPGFSSAARPG